MNGEEVSTGRAFAHLQDGTSYELPRLGKVAFENAVANPATGNATVVIGDDDTSPLGEVHLYLGHKTKTGTPVDMAGLTNGTLFGIVVDGVIAESRADGLGANSKPFSLHDFGDVSSWSAAQLQAADTAAGVTQFLRPEDGAWDPSNPDDFYFATTDRFDTVKTGTGTQVGRSRLWRLRFENVKDPEAGGTITMLVDGTEPHEMFDNLTIDRYGHVLLQEDPGAQNYVARVWQYDIAGDQLKVIASHDPDRFAPGAANFLTIDEESSGIIDAESLLGPGWFLLDVQAHYPNGPTLVEGGQLLALFNPDTAAAAGG
jgi:secreted PhoX family phosphatase